MNTVLLEDELRHAVNETQGLERDAEMQKAARVPMLVIWIC